MAVAFRVARQTPIFMHRTRQDAGNAMSGHKRTLSANLQRDAQSLDTECRRRFGVSGAVFRTAKFIFYIAVLAFSAFVIESTGVDATFVLFFAALLISGPEGAEAFLVRKGVVEDTRTDE